MPGESDEGGYEVDERGRVRLRVDGPLGDQPELRDLWIPVAGTMTADEITDLFGNRHLVGLVTAAIRVAASMPPARRAQVHRQSSETYEQLGQLDEAIEQCELAIEADPALRLKGRLANLEQERARQRSRRKKGKTRGK